MKKSTLLYGSIAILLAIMTFSLTRAGGFDLLIGTAQLYNGLRAVLIVSLLVLAVTVRPRSRIVRGALAAVSALITVVTISLASNYSLPLIDALIFLASATALMNEAIEGSVPETIKVTKTRRLGTA